MSDVPLPPADHSYNSGSFAPLWGEAKMHAHAAAVSAADNARLREAMSNALDAWDTTTLFRAGDQHLQERMEGIRSALFPNCGHEKRRVTQQGVTYADWRCCRCTQYGRDSWD